MKKAPKRLPTTADAKRLATTHNLKRIIVFFEEIDGRFGYASYGRTKSLCQTTREIADGLWSYFKQLLVRAYR